MVNTTWSFSSDYTVPIAVNLTNWTSELVWSYSTQVQICQDSWVPVCFQVHWQLNSWRSSGFLRAQVVLINMAPQLLGVLRKDDIQAAGTVRLTVTWFWSPRAHLYLGIFLYFSYHCGLPVRYNTDLHQTEHLWIETMTCYCKSQEYNDKSPSLKCGVKPCTKLGNVGAGTKWSLAS